MHINSNNITLSKNLCRTCMNGNSNDSKETGCKNHSAISIFNNVESVECENITIMELLLLTTPQLNIDSGDLLPKTVCEDCLKSLINVYNFQKMCIRVEQQLREMSTEIPTEYQVNNDPFSTDNVGVLQTMNDITNNFNVKVHQPLIDQNEYISEQNVSDETISNDGKQSNIIIQNDYSDDDWESEWEISSIRRSVIEYKDNAFKKETSKISKTSTKIKSGASKEDEASQLSKNSTQGLKSITHIKNGVIKNFNRNGNCLSLERHKRKQSETNVLNQIVKEIKDDASKEEQTLEISTNCTENFKIMSNIKRDEGNNNFECRECGKHFASRFSLKRHKRKHSELKMVRDIDRLLKTKYIGNKAFQCDECEKCLPTCKELKQHKLIHLTKSKKHECEFCKKVYKRKASLKEHLRKHTGENYLCSECGKVFYLASGFREHFLRHSAEKTFKCPDCPMIFRNSSNLSAHKSVHKDIKPHVCKICGSAFRKPYLLRKHAIYHNAERNQECNFCEKKFITADHLRRHLRIHTGEKPYKCKYCEKAYTQNIELMKHLRVHLGDNVYKCDLCPRRFRLHGDLRSHFYAHNNDDEETRAQNLQALRDEERSFQIKFSLIKCT